MKGMSFMKNKTAFSVSFILILMLLATVSMYIFWLPDAIDYVNSFLYNSELQKISEWILYSASFIISLPIILVFIMAFKFVSAIKNDTIFHTCTAKLIKAISIIIFSDCTAFGICAVFLLIVGESLLSPIFIFVTVIGITVSLMLRILSNYVERAAILKEEADLTL